MKYGYKHKTGIFGTDAERYNAQLFLMYKNPNGTRRPDLVSINGRFKPKLSLEVKSGRSYKGVMANYQLHYAVTTDQDYIDLFDKNPPEISCLLPGFDSDPLSKSNVAYYYNVINRNDELMAKDLNKPFSTIKLRWGSQFLVPHEFGFYNFAINRARRLGESVEESIEYLKEMIREDVIEGGSNYEKRKDDCQSWQDLHGRDILPIFLGGRKSGRRDLGSDILADFPNTKKILTRDGKERIKLIHEYYPELEDLRRILIPAPNNTRIYALVKREDYNLINTQFRAVVQERTPIIEELTREREKAESLLDKIKIGSYGLYESGDIPKETTIDFNLSREETWKLKRLCLWLTEEESKLSEDMPLPVKPDDLVPI
ncbi:hypothetical protein CMI45_01830 [Candidatus Pacearchaeota archaeon]|jgi:hypothetical protein|nr:hypothetical protein [Candidatus Pacearchaeota archaeon]|tara:strand:+ start:553 stop:1668 length:1116 start_codon:yes stop_codon:yes gene_type:complete